MPRLQTGTFRGFWLHIACKRLGNFMSKSYLCVICTPFCRWLQLLLPSPTVANLEIRRSTAVLRRRRAARAAAVPQQGTAATTRHRVDEVPGGDFAGFWTWETKQFILEVTKYLMKKGNWLIFPNFLCREQIFSFSGVLNFLSLKLT